MPAWSSPVLVSADNSVSVDISDVQQGPDGSATVIWVEDVPYKLKENRYNAQTRIWSGSSQMGPDQYTRPQMMRLFVEPNGDRAVFWFSPESNGNVLKYLTQKAGSTTWLGPTTVGTVLPFRLDNPDSQIPVPPILSASLSNGSYLFLGIITMGASGNFSNEFRTIVVNPYLSTWSGIGAINAGVEFGAGGIYGAKLKLTTDGTVHLVWSHVPIGGAAQLLHRRLVMGSNVWTASQKLGEGVEVGELLEGPNGQVKLFIIAPSTVNRGNASSYFTKTFESASGAWSSTVQALQETSGSRSAFAISQQGSMAIATNDVDGYAYVACHIYDPASNRWTSTTLIPAQQSSMTYYTSAPVAMNGNGDALLFWTETLSGDQMKLRFARFDSKSRMWGQPTTFPWPQASHSNGPRPWFTANGDAVLIWQAYNSHSDHQIWSSTFH